MILNLHFPISHNFGFMESVFFYHQVYLWYFLQPDFKIGGCTSDMSKSNQSVHAHLTFTVNILRYWTKFRLWHANLAKLRHEKVWNSDGEHKDLQLGRIVDDNNKLVYLQNSLSFITMYHGLRSLRSFVCTAGISVHLPFEWGKTGVVPCE